MYRQTIIAEVKIHKGLLEAHGALSNLEKFHINTTFISLLLRDSITCNSMIYKDSKLRLCLEVEIEAFVMDQSLLEDCEVLKGNALLESSIRE